MDEGFTGIRSLGEENLIIYIKDHNVFLPNCRKGIELSIVRHESELNKDDLKIFQ